MRPSADRPRILVVDDLPEMSEMIADDLCDRGYDGVAVASGREALRRLRTERVDLLLTDLQMPEVGGLTLLRESLELDPARPVIVLTAHGSVETAVRATCGGACHYLTKPFRLDVLSRLIRSALTLGR